ncbi:MAG: hypothetical protein SPK34_08070, partial [Bacteroidaceae bacterium]|nr:hypothetical protein [Prevotellaceae bacterium]MDY5760872.1 hypothetical protein [Bacteroidaceae bacterium]
MKKLLLLGIMLLGIVGGVKAGKLYATLGTEWYCDASWNAGTKTMSWNGIWAAPSGAPGSLYFINTGLPSGNITSYTKFHATLSNFSDNVDYILLRIKQGDNNYADAKLVAGENNIDLKALAAENPDVDFTKVTDITLWGANKALAGKTIDSEHPASVVIENVYLQSAKNVTSASLSEEITDISYLTGGGTFVIANTSGTAIEAYKGTEAYAIETPLNTITTDLYYYFTVEALPALDVDGNGENDTETYYRIAIQNAEGTAKPTNFWRGNYVNRIGWGDLWSTSCKADGASDGESAYGRDGDYNAVWTITYVADKGFKFFNPKNKKYMTLNSTVDSETFLKLYKNVIVNINTEFDKQEDVADDDIFALSKATGYDAETGTIKNGGWTFATPVDISNWDYLVITTIDNASDGSRKIRIKDENGTSIEGNQYAGKVAGTGNDMYLDRWNNQNAIRISIDYLRINKGLDVSKIKSLTFANNNGNDDCILRISNVYLTDYNNTKMAGGYCDGDVKREYSETGKYGTICLPYVASYAGAEVYSISGKDASGISLSKVTGLLEAGKPYFYMASDVNGQNNEGTVRNVNFFRADFGTYDVATPPIENNGLIGTFEAITAPQGAKYYVLSNNKLYYTTDAEVKVGANKAYINKSQIVNKGGGAAKAFIDFDELEATGIDAVDTAKTLKGGKFYDLSGR